MRSRRLFFKSEIINLKSEIPYARGFIARAIASFSSAVNV